MSTLTARNGAALRGACRRPRVAVRAVTGRPVGGGPRPVHVITTDTNDLFGVHRLHPCDGTPSSFVMAFKDRDAAEAMALGLESHYRLHGAFPCRDLGQLHEQLRDCVAAYDINEPSRAVWVDTTDLTLLLERLRGTRIVVTLVSRRADDDWDGAGVREGTFQWRDVLADEVAPPGMRVPHLNRLFYDMKAYDPPARTRPAPATAAAAATTAAVPKLLPKPRWPPRRGGLPLTSALVCDAVGALFARVGVLVRLMARMCR